MGWFVFIAIFFKARVNLQIYSAVVSCIYHHGLKTQKKKPNTSLLVTNPDLRIGLSTSSQTFHVNHEFWADCSLSYLFVAWFSLEFLEFFKLNPFTKGVGRECLSLKLSFSFPLVFQWQGASNENEVLGTEAQTSSLKLPLKTPAEGLGLLGFFLMDESVGTCFEQHCFVCKII